MTNPRKCNDDFEVDIKNAFNKQKNIQLAEDKERSLVVLKIYGDIEEPSEYIEELARLEILSNTYDVLEITLNSPGGSLNTTVDLISLIKKFKYVATIGKGEVASAAFMLWTMGNVRVVTNYSMYMAHRESYGMYGKTSEHRDAARAFGLVYEEMFEDCFGDLLTKEEKAIADRSEAWLSYKDLLQRDRVISFEDYLTPKNPYSINEVFVVNDGKMFMFDPEGEKFRNIQSLEFGSEEVSDMTEYLYGIAKITNTAKVKDEKKSKPKKAHTDNVKSTKETKKLKKEVKNDDN